MTYEELEKANKQLADEYTGLLAAYKIIFNECKACKDQLDSMKEQRDFMMNEQCRLRRGEE